MKDILSKSKITPEGGSMERPLEGYSVEEQSEELSKMSFRSLSDGLSQGEDPSCV